MQPSLSKIHTYPLGIHYPRYMHSLCSLGNLRPRSSPRKALAYTFAKMPPYPVADDGDKHGEASRRFDHQPRPGSQGAVSVAGPMIDGWTSRSPAQPALQLVRACITLLSLTRFKISLEACANLGPVLLVDKLQSRRLRQNDVVTCFHWSLVILGRQYLDERRSIWSRPTG